jgi:DnaJ-class molecular chaperone
MRATHSCLIIFLLVPLMVGAQNKYVGVKMCGMCHKGEKKGMMLEIWQKSKHANAYKTLVSIEAEKIVKEKGLKKAANESPECLECHAITADAKLTPDGVQCESCHGAGSSYKNITIMKDKAKAIKAGLAEFKDDAAIEKLCKSCHNEKSPSFKEFKFKEMWPKIKHVIPKG